MDTEYSLEDLPEAMDDRDECRERERERERKRESLGNPCKQRDMKMSIYSLDIKTGWVFLMSRVFLIYNMIEDFDSFYQNIYSTPCVYTLYPNENLNRPS